MKGSSITSSIRKIDCVQGLRSLADCSSAMIFADPPYNLSRTRLENRKSNTGGAYFKVNQDWDRFSDSDYEAFSNRWIVESKRVLRDNGSIYVCASQHNLAHVLQALSSNGLAVKNIIVWEKPNAMPNLTRRTFTHSTEFIVWAVKGKGWVFNYEALRELNPDRQKDGLPKMLRDVWRFPVVQGVERLRREDGRALHPTQKPESLVARCVIASSAPGDLVVDPFVGSGTTGVVCSRLGRNFVGFDLENDYIKAARRRIAQARKQE